MRVFGKLSPTNGCAIHVSIEELRDQRIPAVLLSTNGDSVHIGILQVTKGDFINAPKGRIRSWLIACGRTDDDLRGAKNERNTVFYFLDGSNTYHLHFADIQATPTTSGGASLFNDVATETKQAKQPLPDVARYSTAATPDDTRPLEGIRQHGWREVPTNPGVYWWYFPTACLDELKISKFCKTRTLNLRRNASGKVCLYVGVASSLRERLKWHAAQRLTPSSLESGFLSTLRKTLLALTWIDYGTGFDEINRYMDRLEFSWRTTADLAAAKQIESDELGGNFHYPLNLQGNRRDELQLFLKFLKQRRKEYKDSFSE